MDKTPFKVYSQPFSDSILFVSHGDILDAYSTDDLTLLTSLPSSAIGHRSFFLPDGRMVYEICGDTYVTDSSPLAVATKKLEELKRGHWFNDHLSYRFARITTMKKHTILAPLGAALLLSSCSPFVSHWSAKIFTHSNTIHAASMTFDEFEGLIVFNLKENRVEDVDG